jgi:hypothetical protein
MPEGRYIDEIKTWESVHRFQDEDGNTYGVRVIGPGEHLFFQMNDRALICMIDAEHHEIYERSIRKWDDGKRITPKARGPIAEKILHYYRMAYDKAATLSDSDCR